MMATFSVPPHLANVTLEWGNLGGNSGWSYNLIPYFNPESSAVRLLIAHE